MTHVANDLAELDKVVWIFDFLAPARLEVLFGWFVIWSIVPFVVLLVSLPLRAKLLAILLFLPYYLLHTTYYLPHQYSHKKQRQQNINF